jgi:hypothetical protein
MFCIAEPSFMMQYNLACFFTNKKSLLPTEETGFNSPDISGEAPSLRQPGYPCNDEYAGRTRGFVPPGFPEFTLSETLS